ncbi:hypothetical protein CRUP_003086 [Coryphaenoides rupestris]|nr:hypothetical protein CRUP_003086 [Coryphaenoides rupestris]
MAEGWPVAVVSSSSSSFFSVFVLLLLWGGGLGSGSGLEPWCPAPCSCPAGPDGQPGVLLDCNRRRLSAAPPPPPPRDHPPQAWITQVIHNRIWELSAQQLQPYTSLESLDLASNSISVLRAGSFPFPPVPLKYLNLSNNKIATLETGCFDNIAGTLLVLKLNRNRLALLPSKVFRLPHLNFLEMKRNKIKVVDSLTFNGTESLRSLKMQRNGITKLMDGAFFGLNNMEELELEHNNLTEVSKGWLDLSSNHLTRLEDTAFVGLGLLESLNLGENSISHLGEGVFGGLASLRSLDIRNNEISWAIEDSVGVFEGMKKLNTLVLQRNKIKSITKKAFEGLEELENLDLSKNGIMSIHPEALAHLKLKSFLLCDCQLQWLGQWLIDSQFHQSVSAVCAHPAGLVGRDILSVSAEEFVCDDFPKPRISSHPETAVALRGTNVTLSCVASSSSDSPMTTAWRKDGEVLYDGRVENYARYQRGELSYTTVLHLHAVNFTDEGRYQCVVTNHFGSNYSHRARLTVNELPSFLKTPMDLTIRTGTMARLECAAEGHPAPQIAWQKDGGTDFPAARERRMHVMPDDDIFFIANVKTEDMGVYSCTAQNAAGSLSANATLTYTCVMSNTLGTERGHIYLGVAPSAGCEAGSAYEPDGWITVGIVVIVVVCCVVGTSLVWVIVIYHMRRKSEDYSITNTDEMNLPADIPSYLSSQGTLSEPQEGYSNSEAGSHQQLMPPLSNGYAHKGTDGVCYGDTGLDLDNEGGGGGGGGGGGALHCRVGSLFPGRSSFHPGEEQPRGGDGLAGPTTGGAGPLVICSDCYDNANIYSRTRDYCPYAYLGAEEDDVGVAELRAPRREDPTLESLIGQQNSSSSSSGIRSGRSFWGEGEAAAPIAVAQLPVTRRTRRLAPRQRPPAGPHRARRSSSQQPTTAAAVAARKL